MKQVQITERRHDSLINKHIKLNFVQFLELRQAFFNQAEGTKTNQLPNDRNKFQGIKCSLEKEILHIFFFYLQIQKETKIKAVI